MKDTGRTALITGAGSGIGSAVAQRLACRQGMKVALLGRTRSKLQEVANEIVQSGGQPPLVLVAHQEDKVEVDQAVAEMLEAFGRVDVLINNAGILQIGNSVDYDIEDWDRTMAINFRGPLLLSQAVIPHQRRHGSGIIINNASTLGLRPIAGCAAYCVSKAALIMLTKCMALEEAPHGIRVMVICPGAVDTPIHEDPNQPEKKSDFLEEIAKIHPLGRVGTADDIAAYVEFLISRDASWITGSVVTIDGGISLT